MTTQDALARNFSQLHVSGNPLILPNAWDAASARVVASAGAQAIATTSAGISWALGFRDGEHLPRELALESVARIVRVAGVPITADIEAGFGGTPADVAESVAEFIGVGVVGINLEDSLRPMEEQVERIQAARTAADNARVPLFINARIDTHRLPAIDDSLWLEETIQRARAYASAGASGIFVLGSLRSETIQTLVRTLDQPVNVAFGPGTLSIRELATAGASRISAGSSIAEAAYGYVSQAATEMLSAAATVIEPPALGYSELNRIIG
ncbi:3-methyl-2-oxobutanoate hydroxymethyltransferase [Arthrobacter sp. ERGS1:01]|uniref:isocitrate lyase/PEP mutase family protein n=1 Tax=Arthrobacter sp. ERGS1:01 TaxID=1704044 RepID=UPI0006B6772A|nr:isocitrate lyase/phosphoenolpyruvate mutase family protein [Arthrobacter sp. ERGS1:01]ALE04945.1 3-methyl-2-oxobutanoate hydroxymethyltransferase [Arthrobacter sp. ERGS1:01]